MSLSSTFWFMLFTIRLLFLLIIGRKLSNLLRSYFRLRHSLFSSKLEIFRPKLLWGLCELANDTSFIILTSLAIDFYFPIFTTTRSVIVASYQASLLLSASTPYFSNM